MKIEISDELTMSLIHLANKQGGQGTISQVVERLIRTVLNEDKRVLHAIVKMGWCDDSMKVADYCAKYGDYAMIEIAHSQFLQLQELEDNYGIAPKGAIRDIISQVLDDKDAYLQMIIDNDYQRTIA